MEDATKRFGNRVEHYVRYRPRYPEAVLKFLQSELDLKPSSVIADIGSGTGISSEPFLSAGNVVYGVEPNASMRQSAEQALAHFSSFHSVNGKAEATGLVDRSIDFIVAGQAFHWFDRERTRMEWERILRPPGWVILLWNDRKQDSSFANAYEKLLKTFELDYSSVDHRRITPEVLQTFFGEGGFQLRMFPNQQVFDLEGLQGRVLSCSYMPPPGHPSFDSMMAALTRLFDEFQKNGTVTMAYNTLVYYGRFYRS